MMARGRIGWCFVSLIVVVSVVLGWAATAADARPAQDNQDDEPFVEEPTTPEEGGDCFVLTNVYVAFDPESEPPDEIEPGTEDQVGTVVRWDDYTRDPSWTEDIPDTDFLYCLRNGAYRNYGLVSNNGAYDLDRRVDPSGLPTEGTCLIAIHVPRNSAGESALRNEIIPPAHPSDFYGELMTQERFIAVGGDMDDVWADQILCAMGGIWRRGDQLYQGCHGHTYEGVPHTGSVANRCWGSFPTSNYNITYDPGETFEFDRKLYGFFTGLFFDVGKNVTALALWAVGWAYDFDVDEFVGFVRVIGEDYQDNLIVPFGIEGIVFFILVGWVAIAMLRGKFAQAAGELVMAMVLMTLAGVLLANRLDYLHSMGEVMDKASADLLVAGTGGDPAESPDELTHAVHKAQASLHRSLVEQPYDHLNWGRLLDGTPCEDARNEVLGWNMSGTDSDARTFMSGEIPEWTQPAPWAGQCQPEVDFNAKPSASRLISSLLTMLVDFVAAGFLGGTALTVVASKLGALLLLAVAHFAAALAGMPGGGRRLPWLWVTSTGQTVVTVIVSSFMLSLFLISMKTLLEAMGNRPAEERTAILLMMGLTLGAVRRRANKSIESSTGRLADNLTNWRPGGGGAPWQGPSGSQGMALSGLEDYARTGIGRAAMVGGGAVAGMAATGAMKVAGSPFKIAKGGAKGLAKMAGNSWNRSRTGKVGLKNLRRMKRYDEMAGHADGTPMPWNKNWKALPGRQRKQKWPGSPMPRRPQGGGGPIPRKPGGGGGPHGGGGGGGPVPHGPHGGGGPGGSSAPGPIGVAAADGPPPGGAAKTQWELAKDKMRLDRGAEMVGQGAKGVGRTWDRATAAVGRGAGRVNKSIGAPHPGPGGRPLRASTLKDRWAERTAPRPNDSRPGDWKGQRAKQRRDANAEYLERRTRERQRAAELGKGRRRLTAEERQDIAPGMMSPSQERRRARRKINENFADPDAKTPGELARQVFKKFKGK